MLILLFACIGSSKESVADSHADSATDSDTAEPVHCSNTPLPYRLCIAVDDPTIVEMEDADISVEGTISSLADASPPAAQRLLDQGCDTATRAVTVLDENGKTWTLAWDLDVRQDAALTVGLPVQLHWRTHFDYGIVYGASLLDAEGPLLVLEGGLGDVLETTDRGGLEVSLAWSDAYEGKTCAQNDAVDVPVTFASSLTLGSGESGDFSMGDLSLHAVVPISWMWPDCTDACSNVSWFVTRN